jgi:FAD/FMN-containing dehydrogenase
LLVLACLALTRALPRRPRSRSPPCCATATRAAWPSCRRHDALALATAPASADTRPLALLRQGGNTGLVGGSVPVFDEVVLSTSNMTRILEIDDAAGVAVAQAGVVLEARARSALVQLTLDS